MYKVTLNLLAKTYRKKQLIPFHHFQVFYKPRFFCGNKKPIQDQKDNFQSLKEEYKRQFDQVVMNQNSIQRKVRELNQTGTVATQNLRQKIKKQKSQPEFMTTFTIPQINNKVHQFRRNTKTQNIFAFQDVTIAEKPTILQVTGYEDDFIQVDGFPYPPSVILTPNQILLLQVRNFKDLKISHFQILKFIKPSPQYVIIGVPNCLQISLQLKEQIEKLHNNVDYINVVRYNIILVLSNFSVQHYSKR